MELMPYSESIWPESLVVPCPEVMVSRLERSLVRKIRTKLYVFFFFSGSPCSCQFLRYCPLFPKMGGQGRRVSFLLAVLLILISLMLTLILLLSLGGCPASLHGLVLILPFFYHFCSLHVSYVQLHPPLPFG